MEHFITWLYIVGALAVALTTNSVSAIWAEHENKFTWWLAAVILLSPFVFITFGLVTAKVGVAVGAGTIDALLTLGTVTIGLLFFKDHKNLRPIHYWGLLSICIGIVLMQFS